MALTSLVTAGDLADRNIAVPCDVDATAVLASVSSALRDAAGSPINSTTSTVQLVSPGDQWLDLPAGPVTSVASVAIGSDAALAVGSDYVQIGDSLWRLRGWRSSTSNHYGPTMITVTYTHGLASTPDDIIDLACSLAGMAFAQAERGMYGIQNRVQSETTGADSVTWLHPARELSGAPSPSPVDIPLNTRNWLRARFGTSVAVLGPR